MKEEDHQKCLEESIRHINAAIGQGLIENQRTIGFHTSAAAADLLEMYLHRKGLIDPGAVIKHEWFASRRKAEEKIPFNFPGKPGIIDLLHSVESVRNILCYGKRQKEEVIRHVIENFNELRKRLEDELHETI